MDTALINRRRKQLTYRTLVAEQRRTIRLLQQTMQPAQGTAEIAGLRVTARCTSAEPDLQIGGDWYLAIPLPGDDIILAVGDTTGHGLAAAAGMLRLRFAMAALAAEDSAPARILQRLNSIVCLAARRSRPARWWPGTGLRMGS